MLRTALGPAIAGFLEDPSVVEVMLNPDGRLWIDRLSEGLSDTGKRLAAADGERIVRLVAHHVGAEVHAGFMPWTDWDVVRSEAEREVTPEAFERANRHRGLAIIFGDGAAAMVLRKSEAPDGGFIGAELHSDGDSFDHLYVPGCGFRSIPYVSPESLAAEQHIPQMRGPSLLRKAVKTLSQTVRSLCETYGISQDEIDCFIAHQANDRINQAVRQALRIPPERIPSNIARYGNTSAATIGILTDELRRDGTIREGDLLCFLALGAGLNWGAALLRL